MTDFKPWRPSNGTEGDIFESQWCDKCAREDVATERFCDIHNRAILYNIGETPPEGQQGYPPEWVSMGNVPICTAFKPIPPKEAAPTPKRIKVSPGQMSLLE